MIMMYLMPILSALGPAMIVVLGLGLAIYFAAPHFGLSMPMTWGLIIGVAVVVFAVVGIRAMIKWRRQKKIQAQLDAAAGIPDSGAAGPKVDLSLEARIGRMVAVWRREDPALLQRPWYLVLGPSGSGRRSLLAASGSGLRDAGELFESGEDGQREATFWRAEGAVFICPEASYIDDAERRGAFGEFLGSLRRAVGAVDGVVLTLDLPRLVDAGEDEIAALARIMRERYDHVADRYGMVFPVFIALTQCDQLHGFVDYFDHLDKGARSDALGLLLPYRKVDREAAVTSVGQRFDELYHSLRLRRIPGLGADTDRPTRERATRFPVQFLALRPRLELLVGELLTPRPEVETGVLRGCFFTSTSQGGTTRDRALTSWDPELAQGAGAHPIEVADQRSYFATGLLGQVLPADGGLAYPRAADAARARRNVRTGAVLGIAAAVLLVLAMGISFVNNGKLLAAAVEAAGGLHPEHAGALSTPTALSEMEPLREKLVDLDGWNEDGAPLSYRWGLYHGNAAYAALRKAYFARIQGEFLQPVVDALAADLKATLDRGLVDISTFGLAFEQFYALSMLVGELPATGRLHVILGGQGDYSTVPYWRNAVFSISGTDQPPEVLAMADDHLAYLTSQLDRQQEWVAANTVSPLLKDARGRLKQADEWAKLAYAKLDADIGANSASTDFEKPEPLLAPGAAVRLFSYGPKEELAPVKLYSQAYFKGVVQPAMERTAATLEERFAALGEEVDADRFRTTFIDIYAKRWAKEWKKGLGKLQVRPASDIQDAITRLNEIAGGGSPYVALLDEIAERQVLQTETEGDLNQPSFSGSQGWAGVLKDQLEALSGALDVYRLQVKDGGALGKLEQLQVVATVAEEGRAAVAAKLAEIADTDERTSITRHVDGLFQMAIDAVGDHLAAEADTLWRVEVVDRFARELAPRFPFDRAGAASVAMSDYQAFFDPEQGAASAVVAAVDACRAVTYQSNAIIRLEKASYDDALARLAAMGQLFAPGADGNAPSLAFRVRLIQHAGVEDIRFSVGDDLVSLYDDPDHRGELTWPLRDDLVTRLAIRVERDRWLPLRYAQDPWGPLRVVAAAESAAQTAEGVLVTWSFSGAATADTPAPVPAAPEPSRPPEPKPAPQTRASSQVEVAVAPEVPADPVPAIDNPPKRRADGDGGRGTRVEPEPVAPNGFAGTAKTGGSIKVAPPKSIEPQPETRPTQARTAYALQVVFDASGVDAGLFDLSYLDAYQPPASIRPGAR